MTRFEFKYWIRTFEITFYAVATCDVEAQQICDRLYRMAFGQVPQPVRCKVMG